MPQTRPGEETFLEVIEGILQTHVPEPTEKPGYTVCQKCRTFLLPAQTTRHQAVILAKKVKLR